jgi:hypothetical protein
MNLRTLLKAIELELHLAENCVDKNFFYDIFITQYICKLFMKKQMHISSSQENTVITHLGLPKMLRQYCSKSSDIRFTCKKQFSGGEFCINLLRFKNFHQQKECQESYNSQTNIVAFYILCVPSKTPQVPNLRGSIVRI